MFTNTLSAPPLGSPHTSLACGFNKATLITLIALMMFTASSFAPSVARADPAVATPPPAAPSPQERPRDEAEAETDAVRCRADYARWLADEGEHFRAIGELLQCRYLATEPESQRQWELHIAEVYFAARQYPRAISAYEALADDLNTLRPSTRLHLAMAHYQDGHHTRAAQMFAELSLDTPREQADKQFYQGLLSLRRMDYDDARAHFEGVVARCGQADWTTCQLSQRNLTWLAEPPPAPISPWLAGAASAILPGSGQLYGRSGIDALYYTGLLGLTGFLMADAHREDAGFGGQSAGFYTLLGVGSVIYLANIVGAYNNAQRYNAVQQQRYRDRLFSGSRVGPGDKDHPLLAP